MKHSLLLLSILFSFLSVFSQEISTERSNFKGGLRAGFTASQISGDDLSGFNKLGAYAGGFVNFPLSQNAKWKLQVELNFIMKGSSLFTRGVNSPNIGRKYTLNLFYTETPVMVKYNFFKGFELELGPSINFLFASKEVNEQGDLHRKPFRFYEFSVVVGLSYLFVEHWGINFRFSNSIIPVRIPNWVINQWVNKQYNTVLALSAYYQF